GQTRAVPPINRNTYWQMASDNWLPRAIWIRLTLLVLGALALTSSIASTAHAQNRGHLAGVVRDEVGKPVVGVEVTAIKHSITTRTDSAGHFLLASLPAGALDLSFRRLAYEPVI